MPEVCKRAPSRLRPAIELLELAFLRKGRSVTSHVYCGGLQRRTSFESEEWFQQSSEKTSTNVPKCSLPLIDEHFFFLKWI